VEDVAVPGPAALVVQVSCFSDGLFFYPGHQIFLRGTGDCLPHLLKASCAVAMHLPSTASPSMVVDRHMLSFHFFEDSFIRTSQH